MKKLLLLATLFLFTTLPSWAVTPVPNTEGVSFSFRINGYGNGIMTVYDETGSPWEGHTTYSTLSESDVGTAQLQPGKRYAVNFQSSGVGEYWLSFIVPTGYRLHISDDSPGFTTSTTRNIYYKNVGGGWQSTDLRIELRPVASAGQTSIGGFSGIQIGRSIAWSVGVGGLRTGRSAGKIAFRQPDLTGTPASRANLYWFTPPDSSQLSANYDGPSDQTLRQILGAQAIIDLKDEAGGGYSIKFYRWHLATYNAVTELWEPAYSAWKTILVESPAANQLKISETEGSVTRVSFLKLINGTVSSGDYEWQLQEGDGTNWLRTTTHDSTSTGNNIVATGGTVSTSGSGSYKIHTFTSAGTLNVTATPSGQTIETLIVAGGGGGGGGAGVNGGGGAGGGGVRTTTITPTVSAYSFTVGVGGSAGTAGGGGNGGNSTAFALSAIGGGGGGGFQGYGASAGSGGGGGRDTGTHMGGGTGTAGQGNNGGGAGGSSWSSAGGGGGAGAVGQHGGTDSTNWSSPYGNGGNGITNVISGTSQWYGGGGAGTWETGSSQPVGGLGGGGNSPGKGVIGTNGTNETGGGGSGGQFANGGAGGSGIVIVRYANGATYRDEVVIVRNGDTTDTIVSQTKYRYRDLGWGEEVTEVTADPDTAALTTTYTYHTNSANKGNYRKVRSVTRPTGSWIASEYYDDWDRRGNLKYQYHPYIDTPATVPTTLNPATGRVVYHEYGADWTSRHSRLTLRQEKINDIPYGQENPDPQ